MIWLGRRRNWVLPLLFLLSFPGCSKTAEESSSQDVKITPIAPTEVTRSKMACASYTARLCECAKTYPEMAEDCKLAQGVPQALKMSLDAAAAGGLTIQQQKALHATVRKIASACFEKDSNLDLQLCPRINE